MQTEFFILKTPSYMSRSSTTLLGLTIQVFMYKIISVSASTQVYCDSLTNKKEKIDYIEGYAYEKKSRQICKIIEMIQSELNLAYVSAMCEQNSGAERIISVNNNQDVYNFLISNRKYTSISDARHIVHCPTCYFFKTNSNLENIKNKNSCFNLKIDKEADKEECTITENSTFAELSNTTIEYFFRHYVNELLIMKYDAK